MPLTLKIPAVEDYWDVAREEFVSGKEEVLVLEHSLLSLSKWERKWKIPFLSETHELTSEELLDYVKFMTINRVDESVYSRLTNENIIELKDYISDPLTASTFNNFGGKPSREVVTAEIIYHLMIEFGIWKECEKWPLNSLIALIKTRQIKTGNQPKMSRNEAAMFQKTLNEQRLAKAKARKR